MKHFYLLLLTALILVGGTLAYHHFFQKTKPRKQSGAGIAMDLWSFARSYPNEHIPMQNYAKAFAQKQLEQTLKGNEYEDWKALGPKNIGGRTLALAFNPQNPNTILAASASGGLWRSYTGGVGVEAWERVPTGFPVLGIGAVTYAGNDSMTIYIGTGEVYNYQNTAPGTVNRITRGSYGIGILKSVDGGATWSHSLDWSYGNMRGVNDLLVNPLNPNTIFAATSEGVYRTYDAGENWALIHNMLMAIDLEMHVSDTSTLYVTHGDLGTFGNGIYKSTDGGDNFAKLPFGLPATYSGKALLAITPTNPDVLFASIANDFASIGLFKSTNAGITWDLVNNEDVALWQGWYSHDVAIHPTDSNTLIYVGLDVWKSTDGGVSLTEKTLWYNWYFGQVPVGGPEGTPDYVHGDIHATYYHPTDFNIIYFATDGGIFRSLDGGETFEGCNGGYQTQQFYANFSNSTTDTAFAIGGMQDNATAIYTGSDAWTRVIGGDGMSAAINPLDDNIVYGSWQRLNILKSFDRGENFDYEITPPGSGAEPTSFVGPFELAPSNPEIIYAGRHRIYRSDNGGDSWTATTTGGLDGFNQVITIAVSPTNPDIVYVGIAPSNTPPAKVFSTVDGGDNWTDISAGLPNRVPTDIAIDAQNPNIAYVTFSGFGTAHVFKTTNGGAAWIDTGAALPDVPTNTILIDPVNAEHLYVGNDLGVWFSESGGFDWTPFSEGLPDATLVMHLSISEANRKLRVATHGNGVWETDLATAINVGIETPVILATLGQNYPNPAQGITTIPFSLPQQARGVSLQVFNAEGKLLETLIENATLLGKQTATVDVSAYSSGAYFYRLRGQLANGEVFEESRVLVK